MQVPALNAQQLGDALANRPALTEEEQRSDDERFALETGWPIEFLRTLAREENQR